jgi:hypothetical protein
MLIEMYHIYSCNICSVRNVYEKLFMLFGFCVEGKFRFEKIIFMFKFKKKKNSFPLPDHIMKA